MDGPGQANATTEDGQEQPFSPETWAGEPRFVVFSVPLPAPLGLVHNSIYTFIRDEVVDWLIGVERRITPNSPTIPLADMSEEGRRVVEEGRNFVSLRVWLPKETIAMPTVPFEHAMNVLRRVTGGTIASVGSVQAQAAVPHPSVEAFGTVIEAVTPLLKGPHDDFNSALSDAFDRGLESIALLTRSYAIAIGDLRIRLMSRQALLPLVPYTTCHPAGGDWSPVAFLMLNYGYGLPVVAEDLSEEQLQEFHVYLSRLKSRDPFVTVAEWHRFSHQAYEVDGDTAATVNATYTASEVLLDTILLAMAWEEGTSREDANRWFADTGLATRLRHHYHPRLKGRWHPDDPRTVLGRWTSSVAFMRGRVVHAGYRPTAQEAATALAVLTEVIDFVKERLAANRSKYPRTTLIYLGRPGLERLGLYKGKIKAFVENQAPKEEDWVISFRQWSDSLSPTTPVHKAVAAVRRRPWWRRLWRKIAARVRRV